MLARQKCGRFLTRRWNKFSIKNRPSISVYMQSHSPMLRKASMRSEPAIELHLIVLMPYRCLQSPVPKDITSKCVTLRTEYILNLRGSSVFSYAHSPEFLWEPCSSLHLSVLCLTNILAPSNATDYVLGIRKPPGRTGFGA